ncbi:hypothetical protein HD806DRAFT_547501 [Xylariaceae sp. AK1471]|nr:hypothetical protein HD806DRAFT_547501 [Xylariaceae sp. AK1471]
MSEPRVTLDPNDVVYQQVHFQQGRGAINNQESGTVYPTDEELKKMDDERKTIADFIAETQFDTYSSNVILTAQGYENRNLLKDALQKIDSQDWDNSLKAMIKDGAYVCKAVYQQEIVGVVVLVRLPKKFEIPDMAVPNEPAEGTPVPSPSDLDGVEKYAICDETVRLFKIELRTRLNYHLGFSGVGKVWELSGLGVKERFRGQKIGRTLVKHALSQVPDGHAVVLTAECFKEGMYREIGFLRSPFGEVILRPKWAENMVLTFTIMVFYNYAERFR